MNKFDVIIVGAGPAGLIAAGRAAELGANVLLLEKMKQEGRKLLITGKGRCNITNDSYQSEYFKNIYPNPRFLKHAFSVFFTKDIIKILNDNGVNTVTERGNRVFPESNLSSDVLTALLMWNKKNNVTTKCNCKLEKIIVLDQKIQGVEVLIDNKKEIFHTRSVILCTGGNSYPATGSNGEGYEIAKDIGHSIEPIRPALVPLETEGDIAQKLQGLSLKNANVVVWVNGKKKKEKFGELLFTHFGLSGPVILTLSRYVVDELRNNSQIRISIDLKPALDEKKLDIRLLRDLNENGKKRIENIFKLWLPSKLIPVFLEILKIEVSKEGHQITSEERKKIRVLMKNFCFNIRSHRSFKEAIITAGGIVTQEINSKTMESKIVKNLFFAGEIIDLDADTGGYNLQIAYSTAYLAAQSCIV